MYYNFCYCTYQNTWKLIINNKELWNQRGYCTTTCLRRFTSLYSRNQQCIISGTLYLRYFVNTTPFQGQVSNYLLCTEDEQIRYLDLCKEIIAFEYKIGHKSNKYYPHTRCLIINFKEYNYTKFMLMLTLVRYSYEFPISKFISDILKFYDYLEGKENIVNCIHCVLKPFTVTHGHQTQTIFPYMSNIMPYFSSKENLHNLCLIKERLFDIFPYWRLPGCWLEEKCYKTRWDSEKFKRDFSKRLYEYLNVYNICKLKSM